jgi:hypothetical protein
VTGDRLVEPTTEEPILTVMWHGNRVQVFGDGALGTGNSRTPQRRLHAMGDIAATITHAQSVVGIVSALRQSPVGETHDVTARVVADALQVWLRQRALA